MQYTAIQQDTKNNKHNIMWWNERMKFTTIQYRTPHTIFHVKSALTFSVSKIIFRIPIPTLPIKSNKNKVCDVSFFEELELSPEFNPSGIRDAVKSLKKR